ncbi:hypothetical protein [Inquilinus limosus]|uniref:hypothetical protein n=1 Tax=Inquilinus limosus TaxID=171674 RepID=UPI0012DC6BBE|nr:hypothetical protein [Inquilinus limosus]
MIRRLVGVLLLVVGAFRVFGAGEAAWDREQWRESAVEAQGLVLPPGGGGRLTPALASAQTVVRLGTLRAIYAAVDTGLAAAPQPGERVAVLIDPGQQDRAVLDHPLAIWGDQLLAGGIGAVLALVGLGLMRSRSRRPASATADASAAVGDATAAIASALRQAVARRADARAAPVSRERTDSPPVVSPVSGSVVQRMRDSPITVQRAGGPAVTRTIERPSGAGPILVFVLVVLALAATLIFGT